MPFTVYRVLPFTVDYRLPFPTVTVHHLPRVTVYLVLPFPTVTVYHVLPISVRITTVACKCPVRVRGGACGMSLVFANALATYPW